jgi:hypothetical protein
MKGKTKINILYLFPLSMVFFLTINYFNLNICLALVLLPIIFLPFHFLSIRLRFFQKEMNKFLVYLLFFLEVAIIYLLLKYHPLFNF